MATNLRLSEQAAAAVKAEAERTGRSQQEVIRAAVDAYLTPSSATPTGTPSWRDQLIPPKEPFRTIPESEMLTMPEGMTSLDLMDREDRF
ncbi:MAG: ribbon-helix-helix protein, CopG family [Solirubrobacterales bacterium]|nr:ribbon-helix-helix protein, CopG family [Solirubrobacterales bacterium]